MSYVSDELTHFVGATLSSDGERFELLQKILTERTLRSVIATDGPYDASFSMQLTPPGRICTGETYAQRMMVCFCDIPLDHLGIHMRKYGRFGIAFAKTWLLPRGATPVFYVASTSTLRAQGSERTRAAAFNERAGQHADLLWRLIAHDPSLGIPENLRNLLHSIMIFEAIAMYGYVKCFDPSLPDSHEDNFYMEREWRLLGRLEFDFTNIARVIHPRKYGAALADRFPRLAHVLHPVS